MTTILGQPPPTEEERRENAEWHRKQWIERAISTLLVLAQDDPALRERLRRGLSAKARGRPPQWTRPAHIDLVTHYVLWHDSQQRRDELLQTLCKKYGMKSPDSMEERLSVALAEVDEADIAEFLRPKLRKIRTHRKPRNIDPVT